MEDSKIFNYINVFLQSLMFNSTGQITKSLYSYMLKVKLMINS